jgi:hypothetical protein
MADAEQPYRLGRLVGRSVRVEEVAHRLVEVALALLGGGQEWV